MFLGHLIWIRSTVNLSDIARRDCFYSLLRDKLYGDIDSVLPRRLIRNFLYLGKKKNVNTEVHKKTG